MGCSREHPDTGYRHVLGRLLLGRHRLHLHEDFGMSRIEQSLDRLQRRHDDREPDQGCGEDLEDHDWKYLGSTPDGDQFHKCKNCGKEIET